MLHLATALVRSKLTYGQEVYFSAPDYLLKKLHSLDSKAIKIALGVPIHTKTSAAYEAVGIYTLDQWRKLSCAKYIIRASAISNSNSNELNVRSDLHFPKRAHSINYLQTIATYCNDIFESAHLDPTNVSKKVVSTPMPVWEFKRANFDSNHTNLSKKDNIHLLVEHTRSHLDEHYLNDMKVFTDGSVLDNGDVGAGFVIPFLSIRESFSLTKGHSIFTAELTAILMALSKIVDLPNTPFSIVICSDSKSALQAIESNTSKEKFELIYEIKHLMHTLILKGTIVSFCWIPSHCGFLYNDWADREARRGAQCQQTTLSLSFSAQEMYHIIEKNLKNKNTSKKPLVTLMSSSRHITSLANRLSLNSWRTKYCKNVTCICSNKLSVQHIIKECNTMKTYIYDNLCEQDNLYWVKLAKSFIYSPIGRFL